MRIIEQVVEQKSEVARNRDPAKAGTHALFNFLDARLRGHDRKREFFSLLLESPFEEILTCHIAVSAARKNESQKSF